MPAVGMTLFSTSVTPKSRNTSRMAATESCGTENWVGIAKNDFYSLIDKIYSSEDNDTAVDKCDNITSQSHQRHPSGGSNDSRFSCSSGKNILPSGEYETSSDTHARHARSQAEQDATRALLDMRTGDKRRAERDTHCTDDQVSCTPNEDLPIDLSRHNNDESFGTATTIPSPVTCHQTAALSLLTGIDTTTLGLHRLIANGKESQSVRSVVKAKLSSKISPEHKQSKDNKVNQSKGELGKISSHSKPSAKSTHPGHNKSGSDPSPKECWVRVNKNMVVNLVENLAISSLEVETLGSEENFRTDSPVQQSDRNERSNSDNDVKNKSSDSPLSERNNKNKECANNFEIKQAQQNTVSDSEIDVEKIDQESHDENRFSPGAKHTERLSPTGRPLYSTSRSAEPVITLTQSGRPTRSPGPDKTKMRRRATAETKHVHEKLSAPSISRKRKRADRSDTFGQARGPSPQTLCSVPQMLQNDTAIERTKAPHLSPELNQRLGYTPSSVFPPYTDASLRASVLLSLACDPLMIERLRGQGKEAGRSPEDKKGDVPPCASVRQSASPQSPITANHNAMLSNQRVPTHTHSKDIMTAETAVKSGHYSQHRSLDKGQLSPSDTHKSCENTDMKTARESPKLGWVAVSKEDFHTIVDSVMNTMIYSEKEYNSPDDKGEGGCDQSYQDAQAHSVADNQLQPKVTPKQLSPSPTVHSRLCDQSVISSDVASENDVITPTPGASPTSLSPRSDCSVSDKSISGDLGTEPGCKGKSTSRGFKWKSSLLKRAREEGEEENNIRDSSPSPCQDSSASSPPLISDAVPPVGAGTSKTNNRRIRRNKRKEAKANV